MSLFARIPLSAPPVDAAKSFDAAKSVDTAKAVEATLDGKISGSIRARTDELRVLREARAPFAAKLQELIGERDANSFTRDDSECAKRVLIAQRALAEVDAKIVDKMREQHAARLGFAENFHGEMMTELAHLGPELAAAAATIERARSHFAGAFRSASKNGFSPPPFLGALPKTDDLKKIAERLARH